MELFITISWWTLFGLAVYSLGIIPTLIMLSLDRPWISSEGKLRPVADGFIIRWIYRVNLNDKNLSIPKNLCQLYWGLWLGIWGCCIGIIIYVVLVGTIFYGIISPIAILLGFIPDIEFKNDGPFHLYQRYGKHEEKTFIAPWKYLLPLGLLVLIYFNPGPSAELANSSCSALLSILSNKYLWYVVGAILVVVAIILLTIVGVGAAKKSKVWGTTKAVFGTLKDRTCLLTDPVYRKS